MGYINLLMGHTPGFLVTRAATRAGGDLSGFATTLSRLEQSGKGLPTDPFFRTPEMRDRARNAFAYASRRTDQAQSSIRNWSYTQNPGTTIETPISEAQGALQALRDLDRFPEPDREIGYHVGRARAGADRAVATLQMGRGSQDVRYQQQLAASAANELSWASNDARTADALIRTRLAPFDAFDDAHRVAANYDGAAVSHVDDLAHVKVALDTTEAAVASAASATADVHAGFTALQPGDATAALAVKTNAARDALAGAAQAGKAEPVPAHWAAKVWGARIGTVAVAGTGVAVGVHYATKN
jgi:hypothetical protein